jgi:D-serine dehydratase
MPPPAVTHRAEDHADPLLGPWLKGYPHDAPARRRGELAAADWRVLRGDLPLPLAVLRQDALTHNIAWLERFARERGCALAPHGKTTLSPQLFKRQLDAGAWGITVAHVFQLQVALAGGARRVLIANQLQADVDLAGVAAARRRDADLRVVFLLDSLAQLRLIEAWHARARPGLALEVLLEVGLAGGRTGVRDHGQALALAEAANTSPAVTLAGVECYEGLWGSGDDAADRALVDGLMDRVQALAQACEQQGWFDVDEVIVSAGGSALFDLVAARLRLPLARPVMPLLRSGCYVTHDDLHYQRMVRQLALRCGCADALQPALVVWADVQSVPEPGLAILGAGKREVSFDMGLPVPRWHARLGKSDAQPADARWSIGKLNDQHAYLNHPADAPPPQVGDRIGLGISHPCTTFDKWRWMPVVDEAWRVVDAITTHF